MKSKITSIFVGIALILTVTSCIKDNFNLDKWDKEIDYDAGFALPVVVGDIAFSDALELYDSTGLLIDNEDGYVSLQYLTTVSSNKVNEIIYLEDQQVNKTITSPDFDFTNFDAVGDTVSFSFTQNMTFSMFNAGAEMDSLTLKAGLMNMVATSSFQHSARLYIKLPTVTRNGLPFFTTFVYTPGGGTVVNNNYDISKYNIDMTQTPAGFNEIPVEILFTLYYSGTNDNSGTLSFDAEMKDMEYKIMHG